MVNVELHVESLVQYLEIAKNQRQRSLTKLVDQFGANHPAIYDTKEEIRAITNEIARLFALPPTPLEERIINEKKKGA